MSSEWGRDQNEAALAEAARKMQATNQAKEDALLRVLAEGVAAAIEGDPHHWSARPCQTCRVVSSLLGRPFGCERKAGRS